MKARLVLKDKSVYKGYSFGYEDSSAGEVVFNTGMVGYPETLTDPSYKGQLLVLTYPLIGNYGVPESGFESDKIQINGLIVSDYSKVYNHWNSVQSLSEWLVKHKVPALCGIDTRALTKKLREEGVMLGKIEFERDVPFYDPNKEALVKEVSVKKPILYNNNNNNSKGKKIILIDCGVKKSIINSLVKRGFSVKCVPWNYDFFKEDFSGIFISNGPGNPEMCRKTIENIRKAIDKKIPIMGICLGNQLLALAAGARTYKLKYGHRSQNQPCIEKGTKRCYITSQNHGYAIDTKTLPKGWREWFINANDGTNEGIMHESGMFCSVQFHPEAAPGPTDTEFLFDKFKEMVK